MSTNNIILNNQTHEISEEQLAQIRSILNLKDIPLSDIPVGDTFLIGNYEFVVLEQFGDKTAVILKNILKKSKFGENNNYDGSYVDKICNEFADEIAGIAGEDCLVEHTVDLTSDDGLKDYGIINRKMSILTTDLYRKYVYTLDKHKADKTYWLATADSTPTHDCDSFVKCVAPRGNIDYGGYYIVSGVRPFCIFKSNIFVSK